jgi:exodeoxyribonuclease VII large subunit
MTTGLLARLGRMASVQDAMCARVRETLSRESERMLRSSLRLDLMNPRQVLRRGFVWATAEHGKALTTVADVTQGASVTLQFVDGQADATVRSIRPDP